MSKGCMNKKLCFSEKWKFVIFIKRVNSRLQKTKKLGLFAFFGNPYSCNPYSRDGFEFLPKNRNMTLGVYGVLKNWKIQNLYFLIFVEIDQCLSISWSG